MNENERESGKVQEYGKGPNVGTNRPRIIAGRMLGKKVDQRRRSCFAHPATPFSANLFHYDRIADVDLFTWGG